MTETFIVSDTHFSHANIIKFVDSEGNRIRPFSSVEEHDETIIENWNKVVKPNDKVYHLGDVAIPRRGLKHCARLNGRKVLIKGNHDIYKPDDLLPYFRDIRSSHAMPGEKLIFTHYPIHYDSFGYARYNIHGHTHQNFILDSDGNRDPRYINVCLEHTNFTPVSLNVILEQTRKIT